MGKFYFTRKRAQDHRRKGQTVVKAKLKSGRTIFKLRTTGRRRVSRGGVWSG